MERINGLIIIAVTIMFIVLGIILVGISTFILDNLALNLNSNLMLNLSKAVGNFGSGWLPVVLLFLCASCIIFLITSCVKF